MGGLGSGGWNASGRSTVEATPRLSIAALRNAGALAQSSYRIWRWSVGDRDIARIGVRGCETGVRLIYSVGRSDGPTRPIDDHVVIRRQPCRFGGARLFFVCPHCTGPVLHLHLAGGRFVCRVCADLTYATRRERARDRHLRAANRLRRKLGGEAGVQSALGARPKGMRARTYERIAAEIERREALSMEELAGFVRRMMARTPPTRRGFWR